MGDYVVGSPDEVVGANVRVLREAAGISQAALAQAVIDDGVPGWHPQTTAKVEAGVRSLKLVEALSLAKVLAVRPDYLYEASATAGDDQRVRRAITSLYRANAEVERAADGLYMTSEHLRDLLASLTVSGDVRQQADAALSNCGRWRVRGEDHDCAIPVSADEAHRFADAARAMITPREGAT